jgi:septum site-determining protein MinC
MDNVLLKGNKDGLVVHINSDDYLSVKNELIDKIERGGDFFTGCKLTIIDEQEKISQDKLMGLGKELGERFKIEVSFKVEDAQKEKNERVFSGIYEGRTKFVKSTVRSGQHIIYNGNVVILGDVNSGSEVTAAGNIIVLGVLRGVAHAGSNGNTRAIVAAYRLQPAQLRIYDIIARAPDEGIEKPQMPEIAKIKDDIIVVEPYLPNKYL